MPRTILTTFFSSLLLLPLLAAPLAANEADDLARALEQSSVWESYSFKVEEQPGPGSGGDLEARFQKGKPLSCKADRIEFFRQGNTVVYQDGGRWQKSRTGTTSDPLRVLGAVARVRAARLPHDEAAALAKAVRGVKKQKQGGQTIYTADLSAEAARVLARTEHQGVARGGSARFWVDGDGKLVKYAVTIRLQGRIGGADVDGSARKTVTLSAMETTKVTVPEAARKALE